MSLTELLVFTGSSLKDFNWKYRETLEKRRKEKLKEINSEVDLDGRSVGRANSAAGLLGRQGGEWTNGGKKAQRPKTMQSMWGPLRTETLCTCNQILFACFLCSSCTAMNLLLWVQVKNL